LRTLSTSTKFYLIGTSTKLTSPTNSRSTKLFDITLKKLATCISLLIKAGSFGRRPGYPRHRNYFCRSIRRSKVLVAPAAFYSARLPISTPTASVPSRSLPSCRQKRRNQTPPPSSSPPRSPPPSSLFQPFLSLSRPPLSALSPLTRRTQSPRPPLRGLSRRRLCRDPALGPMVRCAAASSWPQRCFLSGVSRSGRRDSARKVRSGGLLRPTGSLGLRCAVDGCPFRLLLRDS